MPSGTRVQIDVMRRTSARVPSRDGGHGAASDRAPTAVTLAAHVRLESASSSMAKISTTTARGPSDAVTQAAVLREPAASTLHRPLECALQPHSSCSGRGGRAGGARKSARRAARCPTSSCDAKAYLESNSTPDAIGVPRAIARAKAGIIKPGVMCCGPFRRQPARVGGEMAAEQAQSGASGGRRAAKEGGDGTDRRATAVRSLEEVRLAMRGAPHDNAK